MDRQTARGRMGVGFGRTRMSTSEDIGGPISPLDRAVTTYIAGHRGLVGSAIWRLFEREGFSQLVGRSSVDLDLTNRDAVFEFFEEVRPQTVVIAAAKVGGIQANNTYPVDFLSVNLQIQTNLMDAAVHCEVPRLLFLGSSCIYPKFAPQPMREDSLLTGLLEPTNEAYAIAKIAGILNVKAVRRQYGLSWISAMPTNLYGPGDNFSKDASHVLPALIRRYQEARLAGSTTVTNWGSGSPRREFLHVDDMASACLKLLDTYDGAQHVNVGTGEDVTIARLAEIVADKVGFRGATLWDTSKPDGTPRKLLDISTLSATGWRPSISLEAGVADTVAWFEAQDPASVRGADRNNDISAPHSSPAKVTQGQ